MRQKSKLCRRKLPNRSWHSLIKTKQTRSLMRQPFLHRRNRHPQVIKKLKLAGNLGLDSIRWHHPQDLVRRMSRYQVDSDLVIALTFSLWPDPEARMHQELHYCPGLDLTSWTLASRHQDQHTKTSCLNQEMATVEAADYHLKPLRRRTMRLQHQHWHQHQRQHHQQVQSTIVDLVLDLAPMHFQLPSTPIYQHQKGSAQAFHRPRWLHLPLELLLDSQTPEQVPSQVAWALKHLFPPQGLQFSIPLLR